MLWEQRENTTAQGNGTNPWCYPNNIEQRSRSDMEQKNYQPIQPAVYMPETDAFTNAINQLSAVNGALAQENRTLTQRLGQVEDKT